MIPPGGTPAAGNGNGQNGGGTSGGNANGGTNNGNGYPWGGGYGNGYGMFGGGANPWGNWANPWGMGNNNPYYYNYGGQNTPNNFDSSIGDFILALKETSPAGQQSQLHTQLRTYFLPSFPSSAPLLFIFHLSSFHPLFLPPFRNNTNSFEISQKVQNLKRGRTIDRATCRVVCIMHNELPCYSQHTNLCLSHFSSFERKHSNVDVSLDAIATGNRCPDRHKRAHVEHKPGGWWQSACKLVCSCVTEDTSALNYLLMCVLAHI